jgi:thioredoxin 1
MEPVWLSLEKDFQNTIANGVVLVDFNAPWCGPCRFQEPIIKDIAEQFEGKAFVSAVNVDENREIAIGLGIQSIPTLILFKNGQEIQRFIGLQPAEILSKAVNNAIDSPRGEVGYGKDVQGI